MTAAQTVFWIERHAQQIIVQQIPATRRWKTRCILQFRDFAGELQSVGGRTLTDAVSKAQIRVCGERNHNG